MITVFPCSVKGLKQVEKHINIHHEGVPVSAQCRAVTVEVKVHHLPPHISHTVPPGRIEESFQKQKPMPPRGSRGRDSKERARLGMRQSGAPFHFFEFRAVPAQPLDARAGKFKLKARFDVHKFDENGRSCRGWPYGLGQKTCGCRSSAQCCRRRCALAFGLSETQKAFEGYVRHQSMSPLSL